MKSRFTHEGEPIAGSPEEVEAFWAWYGKSVLIDTAGCPISLYHGTPESFEDFRIHDIGIHFGTLEQARHRGRSKSSDAGFQLIQAFIRLENPLRTADAGCWFSANQTIEKIDRALKRLKATPLPTFSGDRIERLAQAREDLTARGFDGLVYRNAVEGKGDSVIVFSQDQIRTARSSAADHKPTRRPRP